MVCAGVCVCVCLLYVCVHEPNARERKEELKTVDRWCVRVFVCVCVCLTHVCVHEPTPVSAKKDLRR